MDGIQLPQGYSHFEEAVYFLPFSSQNFLSQKVTIVTFCAFMKFVSKSKSSENTSLEKLITKIYCAIDYLKECVI